MANVYLVSGLRGPMLALRRYLIIPDLGGNDYTYTTDITEATLLTHDEAKAWSIRTGLWPSTVHNWTPGYGPPQPTEP